ncbi:MAG TPA: hypothetical protein VHD88_01925, partial [Pyrinomonadaceae bacterium]|nr:hypothetical protein [Pyrinomonadaceae bacterium]
FDVALSIDQRADLTPDFMRQLAKLAGKFCGDDLVRRNATLVELFNAPQLVWLKTLRVAVKTFHSVDFRNYNMSLSDNLQFVARWL